MQTWARVAAGVIVAAVLAMHAWSVIARADHEPHMDETEYLHAGWMMANGERLYETFFEHHSPLFLRALQALAPEGTAADVYPYFVHARWLVGAMGGIALLGIAAVAWRGSPFAGGLAIALLVGSSTIWLHAFFELRGEAFALAFFWIGTWMLLKWRGPVGAIGVGLVIISCLWMPKWPLSCLVVGLFWLVRSERKPTSIAVALLTAGIGFATVRMIVPFGQWWFFNFDVNRTLTTNVATSRWALDVFFKGGIPFLYVKDIFHPWLVIPSALLLGASAWFDRRVERILPIALLLGAFLELRLIHPWPGIWAHYYVMWSIVASLILALMPSSIEILMRRARVPERMVRFATAAMIVTAVIGTGAHVVAMAPVAGARANYWVSVDFFRKRLRPGDTVWLEPQRHPVAVKDAHYYWFSVSQMIYAANQLRQTPRGRHYLPPTDDLPPCAKPANLRYTLVPGREILPEAWECMQRMIADSEARRTVFPDIYEVRLKSAATQAD